MSISRYIAMLESLPGTWHRYLPQLKKAGVNCASQPVSRFLTRQSLKEIHAICLAEQVAKAMCHTFPGIKTDPQRLPFCRGPSFGGSLRNALAASRRRRAASGGTRARGDMMTDSEVKIFIGQMEILRHDEMAVAWRFFGANGGVIAQLKVEEGTARERQIFDGLDARIYSRLKGGGEKDEMDRWKAFDAAERFARLDMWFKLVAGEGMDQRVRNLRDRNCVREAELQMDPCGPDRGEFQELLVREKLLIGNPFPGSTLAGYDTTVWVDVNLAGSYEVHSRQGRRTLLEAIAI